jgi:hypothetical protein
MVHYMAVTHLILKTTADFRLPARLADVIWHLLVVSLRHNDHIPSNLRNEGNGSAYQKEPK